MSQITISHPNSNQINTNISPTLQTDKANTVPEDLSRASPSTSKMAIFGRVVLGVFTIGISELVRKIISSKSQPAEHTQPRVSNNPQSLPQPSVSVDNTELANNVRNLTFPEGNNGAINPYKQCLEDMLSNFNQRYGSKIISANLQDLSFLSIESQGFLNILRCKIQKSKELLTPESLKSMAEDILKPELAKRALQSLLADKAQEMNLDLKIKDLSTLVGTLINDDKGQNISIANISNIQDAQKIVSNLDVIKVENLLHKTFLLKNINNNTLPEQHYAAVNELFDELRTKYGENCLPKDFKKVMALKIVQGKNLFSMVKKACNESKELLSPQEIRQVFEKNLTSILQRDAAGHALVDKLQQKGITINPKLSSQVLNDLLKTDPELKTKINSIENSHDASTVMRTLSDACEEYLQIYKSNVQAICDTYLPQVSDEMKPFLTSYIQSLPFDNVNKESSECLVKKLANDLKIWKSFQFGEKSMVSFCENLRAELDFDLHHLEGNPAKNEPQNFYQDNIYQTMIEDSSRGVFVINDQVFIRRPANEMTSALKNAAPTPVDQQFLSKLVNQRLEANILAPMELKMWPVSKCPVTPDQENSGFCFHMQSSFSMFAQPKDVKGFENLESTFNITIAPDRKTAQVTLTYLNILQTETFPQIPFGTSMHTVKIDCALSGGNPNVQPSVTNVEISQEIKRVEF